VLYLYIRRLILSKLFLCSNFRILRC